MIALPAEYQRPSIVETWKRAGCPSFQKWAHEVSEKLTRKMDRPVTVTNRTLLGRVQRELASMGQTITDHREEAILKALEEAGNSIERPVPSRVYLKAAAFDIETTGLRAGGYSGYMLLASVMPLDSEEIKTFRMTFEERPDDRRVLLALLEELWKYDILIHQNGAAFDLNFLNTRVVYHGMPDLRTWLYFDTYQVAKSLALKIGKSLEILGYFFQSTGEKTKIGHKLDYIETPYKKEFTKILDEIQYHCEEDVPLTRQIFDGLWPRALTLGTTQMKSTKWKRGAPKFEAWMSEYGINIKEG